MIKLSTNFLLIIVLLLVQNINVVKAQNWCTPQYSDGCFYDDYIESFSTTGGITNITNNNTGCPSSFIGYSNYSTTHIHTAAIGSTVNFSFTNNPYLEQGYKIWVDWNNNGSFNDAGEEVYASASYINMAQTVTGNFVIPATTTPGTKRLRIRCVYWTTVFDACSYDYYGEAEDYSINVIAGDGGVKSLVTPAGQFCANQQSVQVQIENFGSSSISNFPVQWSFNGVPQTPYNYTGTLNANSTDIINLGNAAFNSGANTIKVWTALANDIDNTNDTLTIVKTAPVFNTLTETDTLCKGDNGHLTLTPGSGYTAGILQWQISSDGVNYNNIPGADQTTWTEVNMTSDSWFRVFINSGIGGCYSNPTMLKLIGSKPEVDLGNDTTVCTGTPVTLDAGYPDAEYLWNDNSTNKTLDVNTPGVYYVTVTNEDGCSAADTVVVFPELMPSGELDMNEWPGMTTGKYTFVAKELENVVRFEWDFGDGTPRSTENPVNHQYNTTGSYTASLYLYNECNTQVIITKSKTILVGVEDIVNVNDITIYPNPANDKLTIDNKAQAKIQSIVIYDAIGRIVNQIDEIEPNAQSTIELSNWSEGIYSVVIQVGNDTFTKKITIVKK